MIGILMGLISLFASFPVAVAGTFYFLGEFEIFKQLLGGIIIATIIIFFFRAIFRKERPNINGLSKKFLQKRMNKTRMRHLRDVFLTLEKRTFASAHVARVAVYLSVLYLNKFSLDWLIGLFLFIIIIGVTRLSLKRHTMFDLLTGFVIGVFSGHASVYILGVI